MRAHHKDTDDEEEPVHRGHDIGIALLPQVSPMLASKSLCISVANPLTLEASILRITTQTILKLLRGSSCLSWKS